MSILYNLDNCAVIEELEVAYAGDRKKFIAGTPINRAGVLANNTNVYGLIAEDIEINRCQRRADDGKFHTIVKVIRGGYVDIQKVTASFGNLNDSCKNKLSAITFVDGKLPTGGGCVLAEVTGDDGEVCEYTAIELISFIKEGKQVFLMYSAEEWVHLAMFDDVEGNEYVSFYSPGGDLITVDAYGNVQYYNS